MLRASANAEGRAGGAQRALLRAILQPRGHEQMAFADGTEVLHALAAQGRCWDEYSDLLSPLLAVLKSQRDSAAPADIASALSALAQLGAPWKGHVRSAAQALLSALRRRSGVPRAALAEALWALAALGARAAEGADELLDALRDAAASGMANGSGGGGSSSGGGTTAELGPRHAAWAIWAAGEVGAPLGPEGLSALVAAAAARGAAGAPAATVDDLTAVLVGASKAPRANGDPGLKRALLALAEGFDAAAFAPSPDAAAEALHALGQLGVHPRRLVDGLAEAATRGGAERKLSGRQLHLIAAGLAMLRTPAECRGPVGRLVRELATRVRSGAAGCGGAGPSGGVTPADAVVTAWAAAISDQGDLSRDVSQLCGWAAGAGSWRGQPRCMHAQLWQCHMFLVDAARIPGFGRANGLHTAVPSRHLDAARAAWLTGLHGRTSELQMQVHARLLELPRLVTDVRLEAPTSGGGYRTVDITATHVPTGRRVAIEVDGPSHFVAESGGRDESAWPPRGETGARDRALEAEGYVVVTVPYWAWTARRRPQGKRKRGGATAEEAADAEAQLQCLRTRILKATSLLEPRGGPRGGARAGRPAAAGAVAAPAPAAAAGTASAAAAAAAAVGAPGTGAAPAAAPANGPAAAAAAGQADGSAAAASPAQPEKPRLPTAFIIMPARAIAAARCVRIARHAVSAAAAAKAGTAASTPVQTVMLTPPTVRRPSGTPLPRPHGAPAALVFRTPAAHGTPGLAAPPLARRLLATPVRSVLATPAAGAAAGHSAQPHLPPPKPAGDSPRAPLQRLSPQQTPGQETPETACKRRRVCLPSPVPVPTLLRPSATSVQKKQRAAGAPAPMPPLPPATQPQPPPQIAPPLPQSAPPPLPRTAPPPLPRAAQPPLPRAVQPPLPQSAPAPLPANKAQGSWPPPSQPPPPPRPTPAPQPRPPPGPMLAQTALPNRQGPPPGPLPPFTAANAAQPPPMQCAAQPQLPPGFRFAPPSAPPQGGPVFGGGLPVRRFGGGGGGGGSGGSGGGGGGSGSGSGSGSGAQYSGGAGGGSGGNGAASGGSSASGSAGSGGGGGSTSGGQYTLVRLVPSASFFGPSPAQPQPAAPPHAQPAQPPEARAAPPPQAAAPAPAPALSQSMLNAPWRQPQQQEQPPPPALPWQPQAHAAQYCPQR
ncbi:hypothetical protein Rsub_09634 [Raphidocelis subcapitata]|uniref:RAP domain-containing protein n=1 Tax=Raphidocelis subcapitata TaxID=307507 RepID=A0A2V0PA92_9CHLO|nr:hypothetical protein Rsub_09634 [Raphidocelis subcapitata]|eukprot:GBF96778.1 hypothetical protein Rsub_09634 [Raphidocelis subcapitata]